jgi:hypothetical protein
MAVLTLIEEGGHRTVEFILIKPLGCQGVRRTRTLCSAQQSSSTRIAHALLPQERLRSFTMRQR